MQKEVFGSRWRGIAFGGGHTSCGKRDAIVADQTDDSMLHLSSAGGNTYVNALRFVTYAFQACILFIILSEAFLIHLLLSGTSRKIVLVFIAVSVFSAAVVTLVSSVLLSISLSVFISKVPGFVAGAKKLSSSVYPPEFVKSGKRRVVHQCQRTVYHRLSASAERGNHEEQQRIRLIHYY